MLRGQGERGVPSREGVLGLVVFGAYSIFDFWRLKRADMSQAVPIAASIFLDIFNVLLLFLSLFGGGRR